MFIEVMRPGWGLNLRSLDWMPRLIRVFAGCTDHFVGCVMRQLELFLEFMNNVYQSYAARMGLELKIPGLKSDLTCYQLCYLVSYMIQKPQTK